MALIYRWFTWVYLLKMGGFSMAMLVITRWYPRWHPSHPSTRSRLDNRFQSQRRWDMWDMWDMVKQGDYSQYSYIACKCPSSKWQFIMTDRYLWHLMALMFGYVLPRPEFHYFLWNIPGDRGIFHLGDQNCLNSTDLTDLTFLFVDVCCKQISVYNIRDCNGGCWQSNSCTGQL